MPSGKRPMRSDYLLSQLDVLEAESIHIMREVAAEFERPALLFSGGKDSIVAGGGSEETGRWVSRNRLQTVTLLDAIEEHRFDAVFGGARRDEEKARAKERMFSFRDEFGQWDPKNQRPELWNLYNTKLHRGEHIRVFPLSNWTELDVWHYIWREELEIPSIYFAHQRQVFERDGILLADSSYVTRGEDEQLFDASVGYRTAGDMTCTAAGEAAA